MLVISRLRYVAESEWGSRRYLGVSLLGEQPYRTAGCPPARRCARNLTVPAAGIFEFPYGCRCFEAVLDLELDRSRPLLKGVHVILQTPSFGTDFRYHPPLVNQSYQT